MVSSSCASHFQRAVIKENNGTQITPRKGISYLSTILAKCGLLIMWFSALDAPCTLRPLSNIWPLHASQSSERQPSSIHMWLLSSPFLQPYTTCPRLYFAITLSNSQWERLLQSWLHTRLYVHLRHQVSQHRADAQPQLESWKNTHACFANYVKSILKWRDGFCWFLETQE